ncbi:site-specific integrase [Prochlorococcus sp. MIT 1300]|uniref:site-specific integrase n=1 Tax=Prochlorococcus sp. MIT 1300 TaxID=3096218 RepID=UPI002A7575B5|nr:site-specific integrase [Prochlorococcus sp. MIT 1300]
MALSNQLNKINTELSRRGVRLRIEHRGDLLNLRGHLPCKKETGKSKIQRISLKIQATQEGLKEAQKILELVHLELERKQFKWNHWSTVSLNREGNTTSNSDVVQAIKSFESAFFTNPQRKQSPSGSRTTWTAAYLPYLRRLQKLSLQGKGQLSIELLKETIASYEENSRSRQQSGIALGALARHLEISLPKDWKAHAGGYGLHKANFRKLPNDEQIVQAFSRIPNPRWKLAFGLMATYGLRNHEIFYSDLSTLSKNCDQVLRVLPNTKTGEHQVWPFHPEWIEEFGLYQLGIKPNLLPLIETDLKKTTLQQVGRRVAEQFRRYSMPLTPYDLRHAWAIRTIHIGLPDTVAARMMGHSVAIHTRTYHHWITKRDQQQAVDAALARARQ